MFGNDILGSFSRIGKDDLLDKVEQAIELIEKNPELKSVDLAGLSYADLRGLRKHLVMEHISLDLSAQNLRKGTELMKKRRGVD